MFTNSDLLTYLLDKRRPWRRLTNSRAAAHLCTRPWSAPNGWGFLAIAVFDSEISISDRSSQPLARPALPHFFFSVSNQLQFGYLQILSNLKYANLAFWWPALENMFTTSGYSLVWSMLRALLSQYRKWNFFFTKAIGRLPLLRAHGTDIGSRLAVYIYLKSSLHYCVLIPGWGSLSYPADLIYLKATDAYKLLTESSASSFFPLAWTTSRLWDKKPHALKYGVVAILLKQRLNLLLWFLFQSPLPGDERYATWLLDKKKR